MKHIFTFKTAKFLLPTLVLFLVITTACNKKSDNQAGGTAHFEFTNASQDASPMDLYINGAKQNTLPVPYCQTTNYYAITAGIKVPGLLKTSASGATIASFNLQLPPDNYYSVFQSGDNTTVYVDDLSIVAGKARVRFINLNLDLKENLDFGITDAPTPLAVNLGQLYDSPYYAVAPGSSFSVYATGTKTSLLDIPTTLEAGHVYTIFLSGTLKADLKATVLVQK